MVGGRGETHAAASRQAVLHADDFGMNSAVTDGILQGFQQGLLTSTSLLANSPDADRALREWQRLEEDRAGRRLPSMAKRRRLHDPDRPFDLGIHLNLTQGRPLTPHYPTELLDADGRFPSIFTLFGRLQLGGRRFAAAVLEELSCQVQFMLDRDRPPTHLNGHQYIELFPVVGPAVESLLAKYKIAATRVALDRAWLPAILWREVNLIQWLVAGVEMRYARRFRRRIARLGVSFPDAYFGALTAGRTDLVKLHAFLGAGSRFRISEIALHPGCRGIGPARDDHDGWYDPLAEGRFKELQLLVSEDFAAYLEQFDFRLGRIAAAS